LHSLQFAVIIFGKVSAIRSKEVDNSIKEAKIGNKEVGLTA
jgi:hypothetical protein